MPDDATARCHCGSVELRVTFPSRFCCHCYCESCRRTHAAGVVTWIGFNSEQVVISKGAEHVQDYASSPGTSRKFCRVCGTRISFESQRWPGETHIPLALFVSPVDREPSSNVFAQERPEWSPLHAFADG
jgi:hypothetical protein